MAITRWDAVVDAVVSAVTTQVGATATVYDGPPVSSEPLTDAVIIGAVDNETVSGTLDQDWRTMGGESAKRDETATIRGMVVAQRGDTDMSTTRAAAVTLLGQVETALRADIDAGVVDALWIELQAGLVSQVQNPNGSECWITFTLAYRAVI